MEKQVFEKLNRIANYIFLEICDCMRADTELKNYYIGGLDLIESLIDGETK